MVDLLLKNGNVVFPDEIVRTNIGVKDGKIVSLSDAEEPAAVTRDVEGLYILPGCIDTHCHFRDPGATQKEDFAYGTRAAAVGGVTTVFDMPNTNPAVIDAESLRSKQKYLQPKAYVDYALWGLSLGQINIDALAGMGKAGACAIKFFWGYALDAKTHALIYNYDPADKNVIPPFDDGAIYELFEKIAETGQTIAIHAENSELIRVLTQRNQAHASEGYSALLASRPALAEELTIQTAISFVRATGARLHVLHVSSAAGVELIRRAKAEGLPVTAETAPHYLFLSADDYDRIGPMIKVYPVVKEEKDRQALWRGLEDGTLDFVASDHAPHTLEEKRGGLFESPSGMCGVESMLPLLLGEVSKGHLTLPFVSRVLSANPARIYHVPNKGGIKEGNDADLVICDMNRRHPILNSELHSKQPLTAFDGMEIQGWPIATYLRGQLIAEKQQICVAEPGGQWLSLG